MATALGVKGEEYVRLVGHGADALFGLVRDLAIRCDAQQAGWILPAHRADRMRALETRAEEWRGFGRNVELLDAAETARRTGSRAFHGALLDEEDGDLRLAVDLGDAGEDVVHDRRRQSHRGLVEHQQARARRQAAPDGEHLLLAARKRSGLLFGTLAQAREPLQ